MNWEETIQMIQRMDQYKNLIKDAYLESDLKLNIERFEESEEFKEVLKIINKYASTAINILDIGSGNGISCCTFSKLGYKVTAVEPDPSPIVGTSAIYTLKKSLSLNHLEIIQKTAEEISLQKQFDVIYARQTMHHAINLTVFTKNLFNHCKPGGLLLTTRDHVIFSPLDKRKFLNSHPLHKFYKGENAYTINQYIDSLVMAGFKIIKILKHFDSVINYAPLTTTEKNNIPGKINNRIINKFSSIPFLKYPLRIIYKYYKGLYKPFNEKKIVGRNYSFICIRPEN